MLNLLSVMTRAYMHAACSQRKKTSAGHMNVVFKST